MARQRADGAPAFGSPLGGAFDHDRAVHFLPGDLQPAAGDADLGPLVGGAIKIFGKRSGDVGLHEAAIADVGGDRAMVGDLRQDFLQDLFVVGANLQQGMAGVVSRLPDRDLLDFETAAAAGDGIEDFGQDQTVDDVAADFDLFHELAVAALGRFPRCIHRSPPPVSWLVCDNSRTAEGVRQCKVAGTRRVPSALRSQPQVLFRSRGFQQMAHGVCLLPPLAKRGPSGDNKEMFRMNRIFMIMAGWMSVWLAARVGCAGVVVLQNWTPAKIDYVLRLADGRESRQSIAPTDVASIPSTGPIAVTLGEGPAARTYALSVNSIHYLAARDGPPELLHLNLPGVDGTVAAPAQPPVQAPPGHHVPTVGGTTSAPQPADGIYKIPVAILVDSADPRTQAIWEKRVRKRLAETSDIFEHHCHVRFEIVKVGTWVSDPAIRSFDQSLMEFAQKVRPFPARLAIGFTSHYQWLRGEMHLGGTHGALASHILIRESPGQVSEPERLEVLVHELGHFLGAAHTADKSSVMRPLLGDRQSAAKSFRIGFDAPNTLIMSLMAEEMRTRHIWHPSLLSPAAKAAVRGAYMVLRRASPETPCRPPRSKPSVRRRDRPLPPAAPAPNCSTRRGAWCWPSPRRPARTRACPSVPRTPARRCGGATTS